MSAAITPDPVERIVYVDRVEKVNRETGAFALMCVGVGIWVGSWLSLAGGLFTLLTGTLVAFAGMCFYIFARHDRLDRTRPARREGRF